MPVATLRRKLVAPSEPHLDLRVLSQFLVVADALNMTIAARRMGVSTPAVSQIVLRLESQLGTLLFERNPHGLRLTPAGRTTVDGAFEALIGAERELLVDLPAKDRTQLASLLRTLMTPFAGPVAD